MVSFTKEYEEKADELERKVIAEIEKYYDELIGKLEILSDYVGGKTELNTLKRNKKKVYQQVSGTIKNSLSTVDENQTAIMEKITEIQNEIINTQELTKVLVANQLIDQI